MRWPAIAAIMLTGLATLGPGTAFTVDPNHKNKVFYYETPRDLVTDEVNKPKQASGSELNASPRAATPRTICETLDCIESAASILRNMDKSVDPCDDFYQFACGNYLKETMIPDDKSSVSTFSVISDKLREQLRSIYESKVQEDDLKPFKLLKTYYKTCMNETHVNKYSEDEFKEVLTGLGGWPVLLGDAWNSSNFDWKNLTYKLLEEGYDSYFISVGFGIDLKNNTKRIITLDQAVGGSKVKIFAKGLDDEINKAYYKYMVNVAVILGADRDKANKELLDVLKFEMELSKISLPSEKRRDPNKLYNPMKVSELTERYPNVPWAKFINTMLFNYANLTEHEKINVAVPSFLDDVDKLLNATNPRVLKNFALWKVTEASAAMMSDRIRDQRRELSKLLSGSTVRPPRWRKCVADVTNNFHLAASSLYVKKFFDESAKKNALEMIHNIRETFTDMLRKSEWMDEKTRVFALEKLTHMYQYIAYPDELLDKNKLEEFYQKLDIDEKLSYYKSQMRIVRFYDDRRLSKFRKPYNKTEWTNHGVAAIVNAFYSPSGNSIEFPAGILQGAFFRNLRPKYLNYGGIGQVVGHEITHGFDDQGKEFDKDGNLVNWWEEDTKKRFLKRAKCIIDQYSNYTVEEVKINLNGINTQGENIADIGGIKEAYYSYQEWENKNGVEPSLPGLNYTPQQMFWIGAANIWCEKERPEASKYSLMADPHSPGRFRVTGQVTNLPEFARDFNCPLNSKMNPGQKCAVW